MRGWLAAGFAWLAASFILLCSVLIVVMTLVQLPEDRRLADGCSCKPEIKGKLFYASLCQSSSIKGPVLQECLYR